MKRKALPLKLDTDSPAMTEAVDAATAINVPLRRTSPHQIKSGQVNFWPSTGKVSVDGTLPIKERGLKTFLALAESAARKAEGDSLGQTL
jgi:hypothetical protein